MTKCGGRGFLSSHWLSVEPMACLKERSPLYNCLRADLQLSGVSEEEVGVLSVRLWSKRGDLAAAALTPYSTEIV